MYFPYQLTAMQQAVETRMPKMGNLGAPTAADLRDIIERQHLIIQSLLMLLIDKQVITEQELVRWIEFADPLDGRVDGKLAPDKAPVTCTKCGRVSPSSSARCMYCNAELSTGVLDRRAETKKVPPSCDGGKSSQQKS